jgi:hypothetical protein
VKIFIKRSVFLSALFLIFSGIISCEKDFNDIGTTIINNSQFATNDTILEVEISMVSIDQVRGDGIGLPAGILGQYLLGVYNNNNYQKIEASIVSQLGIFSNFDVVGGEDTDTTDVHTEFDLAILRIPYQATLTSVNPRVYSLDSVIGNRETPFTLNVYEIDRFLNNLDPVNPSQGNSYQSNLTSADYSPIGSALNADMNYQFIPSETDTVYYFDRTLKSQETFKDSIKLANGIPFATIPLNKQKFEEFMSKYDNAEFDSQDAFNNYFRGILLEATGSDGSLVSLSLSDIPPSVELYYTNTVTNSTTGTVTDTIQKNDSYQLTGVRNSLYKMSGSGTASGNQFPIQGTSGTMANIKIFKDGLAGLQAKNWLVNDASLTFYVDQNTVGFDTIATPSRLFLYKNGVDASNNPNPSVLKDLLSEGPDVFGGLRELSDDKRPNKYNFRITDYVSDLLSGASNYNPVLGLKVYNPTDSPTTDTIVNSYNWNPKAVMLFNHLPADGELEGTRKAQLKISYSERK